MAYLRICHSSRHNFLTTSKDKLAEGVLGALKKSSSTKTYILIISFALTPALAPFLALSKSVYTNRNLYINTKLAPESFFLG